MRCLSLIENITGQSVVIRVTGRFLNNKIIISIPIMYNVHDVLMTVPCLDLVGGARARERERERERKSMQEES